MVRGRQENVHYYVGLCNKVLTRHNHRQQDIANRFNLAQAESGIAGILPQLQRADVSQLETLGALNQAQEQARLDASREAADKQHSYQLKN